MATSMAKTRLISIILSVTLCSVASFSAFAQAVSPTVNEDLDKRVRAEVGQFKGKVSLYAKNLDTGAVYEFGGDDRVPTASTIKIAVMIEAFSRVAEGKARWNDELVLRKSKTVGGSG